MGASQIITALNLEAGHVLKGMDNDTVKSKAEFINRVIEALEAHQAEEKKILGNLSLTQQGQMAALKTLATSKTVLALKWLRDKIQDMEKKDQRLRTEFFTLTSGIDNAVERAVTFTYLWSRLDPLDQAARVKHFVQAAERDDRKVMVAMVEHPFGAMVNDEVKERALTERAKRLTPQEYHNYEQNQILLEFLMMTRDWISKWLIEEVGVDPAVIRTNLGVETMPQLAGV